MKDLLEAALKTLDENVQYGNVRNRVDALPLLNYTMFCRRKSESNSGHTVLSTYWEVSVVRENAVDKAELLQYLEVLAGIPGLKISNEPIEYACQYLDGAKYQLEAASITCVETEKRRI